MESCRFGKGVSHIMPMAGVHGINSAPVLLPDAVLTRLGLEKATEHFSGGLPFFNSKNLAVVALYFDRAAEIHEHDSEMTTVILVLGGRGYVRVGGESGETRQVQAGDAILWPPHVLHKAWTDGDEMQLLTVQFP